jgi:hypothetical protein
MPIVIKVAEENSPSAATLATDSPPVEVGLNGTTIITGGIQVSSPDIIINDFPNTLPPISYHHVQGTSASVWTIIHNLGWYPNVTVEDSAGTIVEGEIAYTNRNSLTLSFYSAFSGNAYLS